MAKKCGCKTGQMCSKCVKPSCHIYGKSIPKDKLRSHVIKCMQNK